MDGFCDHLRDTPWKDIFKLGASPASCEWVQVEIDVYIPQCKYKVTPRASPSYILQYMSEGISIPDCWKVSSVVPVFKNVGRGLRTAKN